MPRTLAYNPKYALNAICPYFTMFPLEYPLRVLKAHRKDRPVVMDPFCGRGTTLFAARSLGLISRGIDSSPIAVAIARAKLCTVDVAATLQLAQSFIEADRPGVIPESDFFRTAFSQSVLRKLCAIRQGLLDTMEDTDAVVLLRAAMLGCLHGPASKCLETQSYFSNQMPRTFAAKPDYSVRYWQAKGHLAPEVDVLSVLRRKLLRLQVDSPQEGSTFANVHLGDSRDPDSLTEAGRDFSIVVTSPPYYGMRTYIEDQWLRNWFLGGPDHVTYGQSTQLEHAGKVAFAESLGAVWRNIAHTNTDQLHMYVRFGIIPSAKADPKTLIRESLESSGISWRIISARSAATAAAGKRQANHMQSESAAATEYDFHIYRV